MTQRFNAFIPFILKWETEYNRDGSVKVEHDPDDPGGTTKYGVDQRSHPGIDIASLSEQQAIEIYFDEWTDAGCEALPDKLGEVFFNAVVNCGAGRARKLLAESGHDAGAFIDAQEAFYRRLVEARPASKKYLKGWLNRTRALRTFLIL